LIVRDKTSLDIFWLKDESLEDSENLYAPDVLAKEMLEDLTPEDGDHRVYVQFGGHSFHRKI